MEHGVAGRATRLSNCGKQIVVHLADRTCTVRTVYVACGEAIRPVVAVSCSPHPLRPRRQHRHPVAQPQVDEHCLVSHDLHSLSRRLIPRMTWSEARAVEVRGDRRSGVWTESERIGQLTAHVDQVFPAWVLHPMWPAVSRGSPRGSCHQAPGLFQRNVNGGILWVGGLYLRDPPPDVVGRPAGFGRGGPS